MFGTHGKHGGPFLHGIFLNEHGLTRRFTETNMLRSLRSDTIRTIFFLYESHESHECLCTELTENTEGFVLHGKFFERTRTDTEVSRKLICNVHCVRILSEQYFFCTNLTNLTNVLYGTHETPFERTRTDTEVHGRLAASFIVFGYYPNNIFPVRISRI